MPPILTLPLPLQVTATRLVEAGVAIALAQEASVREAGVASAQGQASADAGGLTRAEAMTFVERILG
jgi:hypothetical protein